MDWMGTFDLGSVGLMSTTNMFEDLPWPRAVVSGDGVLPPGSRPSSCALADRDSRMGQSTLVLSEICGGL